MDKEIQTNELYLENFANELGFRFLLDFYSLQEYKILFIDEMIDGTLMV